MKKVVLWMLLVACFSLSCSYRSYLRLFKPRVSIQDVIREKEAFDKAENPARKRMIVDELSDKLVIIENALVRDIIKSTNIDYEFCVVAAIPSDKGDIECHIYAKNIYEKEDIATVARLEKGTSRINVTGEFNRFFTLLDEAYARIEIINASITIRNK